MHRVNLLPEKYRRAERRRNAWRGAAIAATPALALALMLGALALQQMRQLDAEIAQVREAMHTYAHQADRFGQLDAERHQVNARANEYRAYLEGGEPSRVLAMLAGRMSDATALSGITIQTQVDLKEGIGKPAPMQLTLEGYGRSNYEVAVLVNALEQVPMFEQVRLELSRETQLDDQRVHAFKVICRSPIDETVIFVERALAEAIDES